MPHKNRFSMLGADLKQDSKSKFLFNGIIFVNCFIKPRNIMGNYEEIMSKISCIFVIAPGVYPSFDGGWVMFVCVCVFLCLCQYRKIYALSCTVVQSLSGNGEGNGKRGSNFSNNIGVKDEEAMQCKFSFPAKNLVSRQYLVLRQNIVSRQKLKKKT